MEGEWFPAIPESSQGQQVTFVTMSTVDDLSYSPSEGQKTRDAAQVAATGRRSWKTLKGKPEAVWPPALEGALIEALEEYRKMEARPTTSKYGVRYPMRNRFISDYIYERTNKRRTAKQVGSRLQQLRDTCKDGKLSFLLGKSGSQDEFKAEASPTPSLTLTGRDFSTSPSPPLDEPMAIYVQLECPTERMGGPLSTPQVHLRANDMENPHYLYLLPLSRNASAPIPPVYPTPSSTLSSFSAFVELVSPFALSEESNWTVYKDRTLIHREQTNLRMVSPLPTASGRRVYVCELVPSLWPLLCEREDPNYITIVQKVQSTQELYDSSSLANAIRTSPPAREVSIVYHFNVPDLTKLKLRPASSSYVNYHNAESSSTSYTHPSQPPYPGYGSDSHSQGDGSWSSGQGHDSYTYRHMGLSDLRSVQHSSMDANQTQVHGHDQYALDASRWGSYCDMTDRGNAFAPPLYSEPRSAATQWDMNGLAMPPPAFPRRDTMSYGSLGSSCY